MARASLLGLVIEFYLPPSHGGEAVVRTAKEAFRPILERLEKRPHAPVTIGLDPGVARSLLRHGQSSILSRIAEAVERGQAELAAGSLGHPLLPRLPRAEIERQIRLGHETMSELMGRSWRPQGLLPPALAWARQVAETAADRGLRWILADELALGGLGRTPLHRVATLQGRKDVLLYFRDRALSAALADGDEKAFLERATVPGGYRVAVVPARSFAAQGKLALLDSILDGKGPMLATLTSLASAFPDREAVEPLPSSWRTTPRELAAGVPFGPWSAPDNPIHGMLWRLVGLGFEATAQRPAGEPPASWNRMRTLLDEGLHTAPFRYASASPWWDGAVVIRAARDLTAAIEAGAETVDPVLLAEARALADAVEATVAEWERTGVVERRRAHAEAKQVGAESELAG